MNKHDFDHPVGRLVLMTRLHGYLNAAQAPGTREEREAARRAAESLASLLLAQFLRERFGDDDLAGSVAEFHEAKGKNWRGWVS